MTDSKNEDTDESAKGDGISASDDDQVSPEDANLNRDDDRDVASSADEQNDDAAEFEDLEEPTEDPDLHDDEDDLDITDDHEVTEEAVTEPSEPEPELVEASSDDAAQYDDPYASQGMSMSSRLLMILLLLIGGGAVALWGGPKLAPMLPGWASPVANFLTPGGNQALQEVNTLSTSVNEQLTGFETRFADLNQTLTDSQTTQLSELEAKFAEQLEERLADLNRRIDETTNDDLAGRITNIETRLEGLTAELATISENLTATALSGGEMTEETLAALASNSSSVDALRAEVAALSGQIGTVTKRVEDAEAARAAEAENAAIQAQELARARALEAALEKLTVAAQSGSGFADELEAVGAVDGVTVDPVLNEFAASGVASLDALRSQLSPIAHEAIKSSIQSDGEEGTFGRIGAFLQSQVATRSLEPREGDSVDAVLSRIEGALVSNKLGDVAQEAAQLPDSAKSLLSDWLSKVDDRHRVLTAISQLGQSAS